MECNKEEAVRARDLAERKLQEKDFTGARKMALKAQQLFPELENLSQILTVCEVHCSANSKVNGETDWYGILQVLVSADELVIKKQYRKLALLLHPDKNKFSGAESAFKLVGEAHMTLTDKGKRSLYDLKRNSKPRSAARATNHRGAFNGVSNPQQQQAGPAGSQQTFWTICHSCGMRYQYYRSILKKALRCQNCLKPFIAYDLNEQVSAQNIGSNPRSNVPPPAQHNFPGPHWHQFQAGTATKDNFERVNLAGLNRRAGPGVGPMNTNTRNDVYDNNTNNDKSKSFTGKPSKSKRRRVVLEEDEEEEEESADTTESEEDEEVIVGETNSSSNNNKNKNNDPPRRSTRQKQNVKYNEKDDNEDDDIADYDHDFTESCNRKRQRKADSDEEEEEEKEKGREEKVLNGNGTKSTEPESDPEAEPEPNLEPKAYTYQDPEFFEFDKLRTEENFSVGQVWAVYDDKDGMPRFYALIKYVYSTPKFGLRIMWLEPDPLTGAVREWSGAALPMACGSFVSGKAELTQELLMFSHVVPCEKGGRKRNTYEIYPRKGEVWALFKGWDAKWSSEPDRHRQYEYELVEIVSDFTDSTGIFVIPLVKINGFVSLFVQSRTAAPYLVPSREALRFSHNVPSYRTKGNEREGVPEGAFELDPASLPPDLDKKSFPCVDLKPEEFGSSKIKKPEEPKMEEKDEKADERGTTLPESPPPEAYEYPDSEFHNFAADRTIDRFEPGQVWALYSDVDRFPKYYACIKMADQKEDKVHIKWLEPCSDGTHEVKRWVDEELPLGCGLFKVGGGSVSYDGTDAFSHLVRAKQSSGSRRNQYEIFPMVAEIWAVYRNWGAGWSILDITENCEYDLVYVSERSGEASVKVSVLSKVHGHRSVFKLGGSVLEIPKGEYMRFSHRIPAQRLGDEEGGKLRGCWELDPASVPEAFLY